MNKAPFTLASANANVSGTETTSVWARLAAGKMIVANRLRYRMLRIVCRRTRSLRRSLRQFTQEIYICP